MKQITLNIPDENFSTFLELIKSLSFIKDFNEGDITVSEQEKNLIRSRIKNSKPDEFLDWEDIKDSFKLD